MSQPNRLFKKAVRQGRNERRCDVYSVPYVEPLSDVRTPLAEFFNSLLGFFDLNDRLALVRSAMQAGVMWQLDLMALRTDGHARRGDAQLLCAPLVASFS
jgi:hypothetical protein